MTLDQVYFLLCERDNLRVGARRVREFSSFHAINISDNGAFKGVTGDGKQVERKVEGKSLARKLMERKAERELKEAQARDAANQAKKKRKTKT